VTTTDKTRGQLVAADVAGALRSRAALLYVVTKEEQRVKRYLLEAAAAAAYVPRSWDIAQGVTTMQGANWPNDKAQFGAGQGDPDGILDTIRQQRGTEETPNRGLWIMCDLPAWLSGPAGAITLRRLRNLAMWLPTQERWSAQAIVILSPSADVPDELADLATVIDWPLPDRSEIGSALDAVVSSLPDDVKANAVNGVRDAAISAAVGLSEQEAKASFARSLIQLRKIDPATVASEKKRVIAKAGMECLDPVPGGFSAVGGLDNIKADAIKMALAYTPEARAYGLQAPKGMLLVGVPGCGKSLICSAIASERGVPLVNFDLGAAKSKFVGESESNLRARLRVVEAIGPCVLRLDEIEKALEGATSGSADGGVSADALGTILTWMQDRAGEAYVIATCNDATKLPPELMRKGRFDSIWWVDLPTGDEREEIVKATLRTYKRSADGIDFEAVAAATATFSGAEVAALIPDAMFTAFADGARELTTADLLVAAKQVVPLATTKADEISKLRAFWAGRARPATSYTVDDVRPPAAAGAVLDL